MIFTSDDRANLKYLVSAVQYLIRKDQEMSQELTDLIAQVQATSDTEAAAALAIQGLAKQVADLAAAGGTPAQFKALADQLKAATDPLAKAIPATP